MGIWVHLGKVIKSQWSNLTPSGSNSALNLTWVFMAPPVSNRVKYITKLHIYLVTSKWPRVNIKYRSLNQGGSK